MQPWHKVLHSSINKVDDKQYLMSCRCLYSCLRLVFSENMSLISLC